MTLRRDRSVEDEYEDEYEAAIHFIKRLKENGQGFVFIFPHLAGPEAPTAVLTPFPREKAAGIASDVAVMLYSGHDDDEEDGGDTTKAN